MLSTRPCSVCGGCVWHTCTREEQRLQSLCLRAQQQLSGVGVMRCSCCRGMNGMPSMFIAPVLLELTK
jgi:hypothetical protein